jgi:SWI/SNF-related matrix-associated actin-dependent regulator of chromatin subfamily A3
MLDETSLFRAHIINPIESGRANGLSNLRTLLKCICLRRRKELLKLPEPQLCQYLLKLSDAEQDEYASIGETHRQAIDDAVSGYKTAEAYQGMLQALLRLRLLCNHGLLEKRSQSAATRVLEDPDETLSLLQQSDQAICAYCSCDITSIGDDNDPGSGLFLACSHLLCLGCVLQLKQRLVKSKEGSKSHCPVCQISVTVKASRPQSRVECQDILGPLYEGECSKLAALISDVRMRRFTDKWSEPSFAF